MEVESEKTGDRCEKIVAISAGGRFYKCNTVLGRGSYKTVNYGLDSETGASIAWCEVSTKQTTLSERVKFRDEADKLKELQHPNIVTFIDFWEDFICGQQILVIITEFMPSGTLKSYLRHFKEINPKIIKSWCRQILDGLSFLHSKTPPIVHRNLKCDSLFINSTTGDLKIGDLDISRLKSVSMQNITIGTPQFMAPEMYEGHYDQSVDIYAFGMTALEMCTGEYPYMECSGSAQIYKKIVMGEKPLSLDKVQIPKLKNLIESCIEPVKSDRPSLDALLNDDYFKEDFDYRINLLCEDLTIKSDLSTIRFVLQILQPQKKSNTMNDAAIQIDYDMKSDSSEEVANELAKAGIISEHDAGIVEKLIEAQVVSIKSKRQERKNRMDALYREYKKKLEMQSKQTKLIIINQSNTSPKQFSRANEEMHCSTSYQQPTIETDGNTLKYYLYRDFIHKPETSTLPPTTKNMNENMPSVKVDQGIECAVDKKEKLQSTNHKLKVDTPVARIAPSIGYLDSETSSNSSAQIQEMAALQQLVKNQQYIIQRLQQIIYQLWLQQLSTTSRIVKKSNH